MSANLKTLIKKAVKPFVAQHYTYTFNAPAQSVTEDIQVLLSSNYLRGNPNITGSIKMNSFTAYHKWTMIPLKGGGNPANLYGTIEAIDNNSSAIRISCVSHPTFSVIAIVSVLEMVVMLLLFILQKPFLLSAEQWYVAGGVTIGMVTLFLIQWYTSKSLKQGLRQTFEEGMGIKAQPENLTA